MVVLTSLRESGVVALSWSVTIPRSVSKLWVAVTYALTGVFKEKIGPLVNVLIAAPACVGRLSGEVNPTTVPCGFTVLCWFNEIRLATTCCPWSLSILSMCVKCGRSCWSTFWLKLATRLCTSDESVAVHGTGIQVGKRSRGELRLQRTQHGFDRRYCRVLTVESLRDQPGQRRPGECLGRCRQQPAIFQMLEQQDPTSGTASTFALSSLSAHRSPDLLSDRSRFPLSMRVPIKTKMRAIAFAWRA